MFLCPIFPPSLSFPVEQTHNHRMRAATIQRSGLSLASKSVTSVSLFDTSPGRNISSGPGFFRGKDSASVTWALSRAEDAGSLALGTQLHGRITKLGFNREAFIGNNLIKMYMKIGDFGDGVKVFDEMRQRNVVSWTLVISGAVKDGEVECGLVAFSEMMRRRVLPNEFTFGSIMKLCVNRRARWLGMSVHCIAVKVAIARNVFAVGSILNFYFKMGDVEAAERLFCCTEAVDTACWNSMIGGYAQCGWFFEVLGILYLMRREGVAMDTYTFINSLQGCAAAGDLKSGRQIHGLILTSDVEIGTPVMNALTDMYFKGGEVDDALKVFRRVQDKDVATWNTIFGCITRLENQREVACLFRDFMISGFRPDYITISNLFRQCGELVDLRLGLQLFALALLFGFLDETNVVSSIIRMFSMCGSMEMAAKVFESIHARDISTWNELISGYNLNNCNSDALCTFSNLFQFGVEIDKHTILNVLETCYRFENNRMIKEVHGLIVKYGFDSHGCIYNSLFKGYVKSGFLNDSLNMFGENERMDFESSGNLITTLVQHGYHQEAISMLNKLSETGWRPDKFVLGSIINSCANVSAHFCTKLVHSFVIKLGFAKQIFVASAVLDAYAKCGDIQSAKMAFDQSCRAGDVIMYNAMIMAYAHHGLVSEAMEIFDAMKQVAIKPSHATFVSVILACSYRGLVDQGCLLFKSMILDHGMKPSPGVYGCLVDMLSRNGYLNDAKCIIETMPYPAWPAILRSLLSGCRIHGDKKSGEWAAKELIRLVPEDDASRALLLQVYSSKCSWEDAAKLQVGVAEEGPRKNPGSSWIEAQVG